MTDVGGDRQLEGEFTRVMLDRVGRLHREIDYNAKRFRQMIGEHGGVGAARLLLQGADASDGFTTLWENGLLELSLEFHVLLPRFQSLFSDRERRRARRQLEEHRFDVDPALARVGDGLP